MTKSGSRRSLTGSRSFCGRAERILDEAERAGRHNVALAGIRELRGILEFAAKLAGGFPAEPTVIQLTFHDGSDLVSPLRALPSDGDG